ncbi:MAG: ADOP family duplicated permease [bacterium]
MNAPRDPQSELRQLVRPPVGKRVDSELAFHIEMRTRELIAQGMSAEEARRAAIARFGNLDDVSSTLVKLGTETEGIMRRTRFISEAVHDARLALRMLVPRRGFAVLAIGTLALGIGAATAIYSVVDGVLLRPLPFDEPDRIAAVWITQPTLAHDPAISWLADGTPLGASEYQSLQRDAKTLRDLALYDVGGTVTLTTVAGTERLPALTATSSLLQVLHAHPALGRNFVPAENVLNGPNVALVSWEAWRDRFGSDSSFVGRRITLNDVPFEIIGVLPPGLQIDRSAEAPAFWLPALRDSFDIPARHNRGYRALARLANGVSYQAATRDAARVLRASGDTLLGARVEPWLRDQTRAARGPLLVLLAAAGLLLLIACVNVAILQLGEASARAREMATRAALGAGAARLVRQLLTESVVIAFLSAILGTALAWLMLRALIAIAPERLPGMDSVSIDGRVLAFALVCAAMTGVLFGIVPAMTAGRAGASAIVRSGAGQSGHGARRVQRSLIALQLALSLVLLVEAVLLSTSLRKLSLVNPGFRPAGLTAVKVTLPRRYGDEPTRAFTASVIQRLSSYPGVERVTAATHVPFVSRGSSSPIELDRRSDVPPPPPHHTQQRYVEPGFFEVLGMRLVSGRFFNADDRANGELVAIVSASEVARDFAGRSPLGRQVKHQGQWRRIVGVVADVKYRDLAKEDEATIYVPFDQYVDASPVFLIRGSVAVGIAPAFKALLHELEPRATVTTISSVPTVIEKSYAAERYRTLLVSAFGAMAALLAAIGLYGVSIRTAKGRTRELGIRLALGGTSATVLRLLVKDAMAGVAIGLVVGVPAALLAGKMVAPYLFGISPDDPLVFFAVGVLLLTATAVASAIPAWKAGRLNPATVLRAD